MITTASRLQLHEQRKIEKLLLKLAKLKPISAKPAPIMARFNSTAALNREKAS
jgi:hypothetical protein